MEKKGYLVPVLLVFAVVVLIVGFILNYGATKNSKEEVTGEVTEISKEVSEIKEKSEKIIVIEKDNENLKKRLAVVERQQKKTQQIVDSLKTKPTVITPAPQKAKSKAKKNRRGRNTRRR